MNDSHVNDSLLTAMSESATAWAAGLSTGGVFLLLIVIVWQIAATWRARMLAAREREYRDLAHRYAQLLEENIELQRRLLEEMDQTRKSVGSMERMMREID